ncbi:MAG: amphi-Trp domain-containing protein [Candidatus Rokuibacteriota bacterium]
MSSARGYGRGEGGFHYVSVTRPSTELIPDTETWGSRNRPAISSRHLPPVVSIPSRFRGRARRDAAAFYLTQLARGILAGELGVLVGHETVPVRPADVLVLEIAVSRSGRADRVSIRVRWTRARGPDPAGRPGQGRPRSARPLPASHLEFTPPSFARNPGARDSDSVAHSG